MKRTFKKKRKFNVINILAVILSIAFIGSFFIKNTATYIAPEAQASEVESKVEVFDILSIDDLSLKDKITVYAMTFDVDPELLYDVVMIESQGNMKAVGDGGRSFGLAQFQKPTFERYVKMYKKQTGDKTTFDIHNEQHHIFIMAFAFSQGESSRNEWTAYRCLNNNGSYSFYSNQLKQRFTVTCDENKYNL